MGRRLTEVSACKLRLAITSDPGLVYTKPALWGSYGISDCEQERGKKKKKKIKVTLPERDSYLKFVGGGVGRLEDIKKKKKKN